MSATTSATILDLVPGTDKAIDDALNWFNELNRKVRRLAEALAAHLHAESISAVRAPELRDRITQRVLLRAGDLYGLLLIVGEQVSPAVNSAESERAVVCALELGLAVDSLRKNCTVENGMAVNDSLNALKPEWKYLAQLLVTAKEDRRRQQSQPKPKPAIPTAGYCLVPPNNVRWEKTTEVQPHLYHLLAVLLKQSNWPVSFDAVADVVGDRSKNVSNKISKLNQALEPIKFPWTFRTKSAQITKE